MDGSGFGNPDRGWNDPPKLAFGAAKSGTAGGSGRHRLLNKRVPIPLNPQQDTSSGSAASPPSLKGTSAPPTKSVIPPHPPLASAGPPPANSPPTIPSLPPTFCSPCPVPPAPVTQDEGVTAVDNTKERLQQVEKDLMGCLQSIADKVKESTQEEIRKRVAVMVQMWEQDQLSEEVKTRMAALGQALCQQDYSKAWSLHQGLIVDYTTTCSPWMVGVKTLIAEARTLAGGEAEEGQVPGSNCKDSSVDDNTAVDTNKESSVSDVTSGK